MPEDVNRFRGWSWKLFKEHVRTTLRSSLGRDPAEEELKKGLSGYTVKILVQEKVGMVVQFYDLDTYRADQLQHVSNFESFLRESYGGAKFKINFYQGDNFLGTKNYDVEGPLRWKEILAARGAKI